MGPVPAGVHRFVVAPSSHFVFRSLSVIALDWLTNFVFSFSLVQDFRKKVKHFTISVPPLAALSFELCAVGDTGVKTERVR